jgi:hypothetical protein
MLCF